MKSIKNLFISLALTSSLVIGAKASTIAFTLAAATATNVAPNFGSLLISQVIVTTAGTNNSSSVIIYDSPTNIFTYTNAAYSNILSYATNYTIIYTNYYGVSNNNGTNVMLIDITNAVAATTNTYPIKFTGSFPSNAVTKFDSVNWNFINTAWITNAGTGSLGFTITYKQ